jgi:hypothetical protein
MYLTFIDTSFVSPSKVITQFHLMTHGINKVYGFKMTSSAWTAKSLTSERISEVALTFNMSTTPSSEHN